MRFVVKCSKSLQVSHEKNPLAFHCTVCLIGILTIVYDNPNITGYNWAVYSPIYPKHPGFFHCSFNLNASWRKFETPRPPQLILRSANPQMSLKKKTKDFWTWWFKATFWGWLGDLLERLSDKNKHDNNNIFVWYCSRLVCTAMSQN